MNSNRSRKRGNSMVLIVAIVIVLLLAVGFIIFRVGNLTGSQREAQTAIDAAALQAAKEVSNVVVQTNEGPIAAIDQAPSPAVPSGAIGINTAFATARLDAMIANDIGNSSMQFLAARDIDDLTKKVVPALTQKIQDQLQPGSTAYQNVQAAYNGNGRRVMRNDGDGQAASRITVTLGALTNNAATNIRVPNGTDPAITNTTASNGYYNSYTAVSVPGLGKNIQFSAVGDSPRIVDNSVFRALQSTDYPTVVQVATDTLVQDKGEDVGARKQAPRLLHNVATAVCGGNYIAPISTTYCVSFSGGFPPSSAANIGGTFDSVVSLMNTATVGVDGSSNGNGPWGPLPTETWFRSPNAGAIPPGPPVNKGFPGGGTVGPIAQTAPSVALSFGMYDWLRSLGLRVNRTATVAALGTNLRASVPSAPPVGQPLIFSWDGSLMPSAFAQSSGNNNSSGNSQNSMIGAIPEAANTTDSADNDSRTQAFENMAATGDFGAQQVANAFGYVSASATIPAQAMSANVNSDGSVTTTDGNSVADLYKLEKAIVASNNAGLCMKDASAAVQTTENNLATSLNNQAAADTASANAATAQAASDTSQANALTVAANATNPPDQNKLNQAAALTADAATQRANAASLNAKAATETAQAKAATVLANRAGTANTMAQMVVSETYSAMSNFAALTALGVKSTSALNFTLAGSSFAASEYVVGDNNFKNGYTAAQLQTAKDALTNSTADTDPKLSNGNGNQWCQTGWSCYTHTGAPVTIAHHNNPMGMQSAYAQTAVPPNNNLMFLFNIQGNFQKDPSGTQVTITPLPLSPFLQNVTASNQCHYVAQGCLNVQSNGVPISFSVQSRDEAAIPRYYNQNSNESVTNPRFCHSGFNMNLPDNGGNDCPTLGGEWRLGCPVIGGCIVGASVTSNGSLTLTPCPPPPPHMG